MSKSRDQLIEYLSEIDITGKTVLDVGSGPKDKWAINFVKGKPKEYLTADFDEEFEVDAHFDLNKPIDKDWYGGLAKKGRYNFDIVFCLETLEHLWNPVQAIENLSKLTKYSLYLSTPFINPIHDKWDYLRYTFQWYEKVLPMYSFKRVNVKSRQGGESLHSFYKDEGMRMSKVTLQQGYGDHYEDIGYFVEAHK